MSAGSTGETMSIEDAIIDFMVNTDEQYEEMKKLAASPRGDGLKYGSDRALGEAWRDKYAEDVIGQLGPYVNWAVIGRYLREDYERDQAAK